MWGLCTNSIHAFAQLLLSTLREDVARKPLDAEGAATAAGAAGHGALHKVCRNVLDRPGRMGALSQQGAHGSLGGRVSLLMQHSPAK